MVDSVSSYAASSSSRSNPFDPPPTFTATSPGDSELADATNGVRATRINGVEVILTQAEQAAEELTYENLRPRSSDQTAQSPVDERNTADSVLTESFAPEA